MAEKKERFKTIYAQEGMKEGTNILVDQVTGVHYMFHRRFNTGGLTVLLDQDGKPVISEVKDEPH